MAQGAPNSPPDLTGFPVENPAHWGSKGPSRRPLSLAWISDELIAETRRVWSNHLRRVVGEDEAIEMLVNVRAAALAILAVTEKEGEG
jgi:hypothetical protein